MSRNELCGNLFHILVLSLTRTTILDPKLKHSEQVRRHFFCHPTSLYYRTRARASHIMPQIRILIAISEERAWIPMGEASDPSLRRVSLEIGTIDTRTRTRAYVYVCKIIKNTRLYSHVNNFSAFAGGVICIISHASYYYIIQLTMCNVFLADRAIFFFLPSVMIAVTVNAIFLFLSFFSFSFFNSS